MEELAGPEELEVSSSEDEAEMDIPSADDEDSSVGGLESLDIGRLVFGAGQEVGESLDAAAAPGGVERPFSSLQSFSLISRQALTVARDSSDIGVSGVTVTVVGGVLIRNFGDLGDLLIFLFCGKLKEYLATASHRDGGDGDRDGGWSGEDGGGASSLAGKA